jgi:hypothetical protein
MARTAEVTERPFRTCVGRMVRKLALGCAVPLALAFGCSGEDMKPAVGSETHFLALCADDSCPDGSACVCGVCTKTCSADGECKELGAHAACAPLGPRQSEGRCPAKEAAAMCDVGCLDTADCKPLGAAFRCEQGFCRPRDEAPEPETLTCDTSPPIARADIVVLGDSLIELSDFTTDLESAGTTAGVFASTGVLRSYGSARYSILADGPLSINRQYDMARADGSARVVVMDGGATDTLTLPCGAAPSADCVAMQSAAAGAELLLGALASDGVEHVVYFFYGDPPATAELAAIKPTLDVLRPLVENACGKAGLACHFLDLRPLFGPHPEYFAQDGVNFTAAGASAAAGAVASVMVEHCVGVP